MRAFPRLIYPSIHLQSVLGSSNEHILISACLSRGAPTPSARRWCLGLAGKRKSSAVAWTGALPSATAHLPTTCTRHLQPAHPQTTGAAPAPFRALPHPWPRSPRLQQPYSTALPAMTSNRNLPSSCGVDGHPSLTVHPPCGKAASAAAAVAPPSPEPGPGTPAPELADSPTARAAPSTADTESVSGLGDGGLCGGVYDQIIRSGFLGAAAGLAPRTASSVGTTTAESAAATAGGGEGAGGLGRGPVRRYLVVLNYVLPDGLPHAWATASFRVCADGGINRLYDQLPSMVPPMEGPTEAGAGAEPAAGLGTGSQPGSGTEAAALSPDPRAPPAAHAAPSSTMQPSPAPDAPPDQQHTAQSSVPGDSAEALRLAHLPDLVLGDLDSLRPDVRQFYVRHSVPFLDLSYDQDTTDLTKAVQVLEERFIRGAGHPEDHEILVLGALGGRLDHTLANLNSLHMFPHLAITLWGDGNLVRLVRPGRTLIVPDEEFEGPTCGLIPMAGPAIATSRGLRWDVCDTALRVGGLVSSSNQLTGRPVEVVTDAPLLWTTELRREPRLEAEGVWARVARAEARAGLGEREGGP